MKTRKRVNQEAQAVGDLSLVSPRGKFGSNGGPLAGFQTVERVMSAPALRIDYQYPQTHHVCRATTNGDFLFSQASTGTPPSFEELDKRRRIPGALNWDPFAVRKAFEDVEDVASALNFLNNAGRFWSFSDVLWSEFLEWKRYFRWLRVDYEKAILYPEGTKAWRTADGFDDGFFTERPIPEWVRDGCSADELRELQVSQRQTLLWLRRFALTLSVTEARLSICWADPKDKTYQASSPTRKLRGKTHKPFLRIEVHSILEAVAATIYADREHGLSHDVCKFCQKIFEVSSDHGREFCPPGRPDVQTSSCKNAYFARKKRQRQKAAKEQSK
jgi:hypothetical protein